MKREPPATVSTTRKKAQVILAARKHVQGYLNPSNLGSAESLDLLTPDGEHRSIALTDIRAVYFVREFTDDPEPPRKAFLSRPKLDGLWVRLRFHDGESIEGVVPNDLLGLLDAGVQITPPDLHGNIIKIFIPRAALAEMTVLGVVGIARRKAAAATPPPPPP
ncbi:MAG: hypothetical protein WBF06_07175, partial [Candidatus Acidiferrales bacterium]